mgnify:CR=1 FL=1
METSENEFLNSLIVDSVGDELTFKRLSQILDKLVNDNVLALNSELAAYSKIGYTEVRNEPFEKTPKQSIKRFMYQ